MCNSVSLSGSNISKLSSRAPPQTDTHSRYSSLFELYLQYLFSLKKTERKRGVTLAERITQNINPQIQQIQIYSKSKSYRSYKQENKDSRDEDKINAHTIYIHKCIYSRLIGSRKLQAFRQKWIQIVSGMQSHILRNILIELLEKLEPEKKVVGKSR